MRHDPVWRSFSPRRREGSPIKRRGAAIGSIFSELRIELFLYDVEFPAKRSMTLDGVPAQLLISAVHCRIQILNVSLETRPAVSHRRSDQKPLQGIETKTKCRSNGCSPPRGFQLCNSHVHFCD